MAKPARLQASYPVVPIFPDFDDNLRQAFRREAELFFDSIVREDRNVLDLLTANYTFLNERLAKHYGIPSVYGTQFRRVTLGPEMDVRRGLLGKGAILTVSALPNSTSLVGRGKWVMQNILGIEPPSPPPFAVPPLDATGDGGKPLTLRQQMEKHRAVEPCSELSQDHGSDRHLARELRRDRPCGEPRMKGFRSIPSVCLSTAADERRCRPARNPGSLLATIRTKRDRTADDLRVGPRCRVLRHAAGPVHRESRPTRTTIASRRLFWESSRANHSRTTSRSRQTRG